MINRNLLCYYLTILLSSSLILVNWGVYAQSVELTFREGMDTRSKGLLLLDNGAAISATTVHVDGGWGYENLLLTKITADGQIDWQRAYEEDITGEAIGVHQMKRGENGSFYMVLISEGCDFGNLPTLVAKFSSKGDLLWMHGDTFGRETIEDIQLKDGELWLFGNTIRVLNAETGSLLEKDIPINNGQNVFQAYIQDSLFLLALGFQNSSDALLSLQTVEGKPLKEITVGNLHTFFPTTDWSSIVAYKGAWKKKSLALYTKDLVLEKEVSLENGSEYIHRVVANADYIWVLEEFTGKDQSYFAFQIYDYKLNLIETLETNIPVNYGGYITYITPLQTDGIRLQTQQYQHILIKDIPLEGRDPNPVTDVACVELTIGETNYRDQGEEPYCGRFDLDLKDIAVTIKNSGEETLQTIDLNALYIDDCSFICSNYSRYIESYTDLNLAPQEEVVLTFPDITISRARSPFTPCFYATQPNHKMDVRNGNDQVCLEEIYLGKEDTRLNNQVEVFPNPAHSSIQLYLPDHIGSYQWELYNMSGQLIQQSSGLLNQSVLNIFVEDLPSGLYFVKVRSELGNGQWKVVKE